LEFLLDNGLIKALSLPELELLYSKHFPVRGVRTIQSNQGKEEKHSGKTVSQDGPSDDTILLEETDGKRLAKVLEAPELAAEVERAVVQVKRVLKEKQRL
jgi:hypothetical protein